VWIDSEVLAKPRAIAMNPASMRLWKGQDAEPLSESDRNRLIGNVKRAFEACGYELHVAEPFDWDNVALRRPKPRD